MISRVGAEPACPRLIGRNVITLSSVAWLKKAGSRNTTCRPRKAYRISSRTKSQTPSARFSCRRLALRDDVPRHSLRSHARIRALRFAVRRCSGCRDPWNSGREPNRPCVGARFGGFGAGAWHAGVEAKRPYKPLWNVPSAPLRSPNGLMGFRPKRVAFRSLSAPARRGSPPQKMIRRNLSQRSRRSQTNAIPIGADNTSRACPPPLVRSYMGLERS